MLSQSSHSDIDESFMPILLNDFDHFVSNGGFPLKLENLIAICVVKDHLIDFD
jgi:hypothetical protein